MIKILSLFSGIGAFEKALQRRKIKYELYKYCEIDKYASKGYSVIHNVSEDMNLGDITKISIDKLPLDIDLVTHGSPCQSFSIAGKNDGGDKGSGTRSSLMWYTVDIVNHCKPKFVIWENVKNLLSQKHRHNFDAYIEIMKQLGYNSYYKVLNAKDYEIPQNRERVYTISIRQDIDKGFEFPDKLPLLFRLKDMLEEKVDEKYYLNNAQVERMKTTTYESGKLENRATRENDIAPTLCARDYKDPKCVILNQLNMFNEQPTITEPKRIGGLYDTEETTHQAGSIWDKEQIAPTLDTMQGGYRQPMITEPQIETNFVKIIVKVRTYDVDCKALCKLLREYKRELTNKDIAEKLNVPVTKVEHWFRQDDCFAIPDAEIWYKLKELLRIKTNEFDKAIMTFETKVGVYEKANRVYGENGISPTITSTDADVKIIEPILLNERSVDAINKRARHQQDLIQHKNGICRCIPAGTHGSTPHLLKTIVSDTPYLRIRKLTPKECWRLMDFNDEDIDKCIAAKISNTQLYKMAGNSIAVRVLEYIYKQLGQVYDEFKGEYEK